jgi:hypothetical protein
MNPEIFRIAHTLAESSAETRLLKANYEAALVSQHEISRRLTEALYNAEVWEPIALSLDTSESLICIWNGEDGYEISLVRSYS